MATARHSEPALFLPEYLRSVLSRKSSRNPNSQFTTKLQHLLRYTETNPSQIENVGLAWMTDDEFKLNKTSLIAAMGIKLNTLNVNLRDLGFKQVQKEKDGWARWRRSDFTRNDELPDPDSESLINPSTVVRNASNKPLPFSLGRLDPHQCNIFVNDSQILWTELFVAPIGTLVRAAVLIEKAAKRFKHDEQPLENAKDVIRAIVAGQRSEPLSFADFCRFLAMFGPSRSLMVKIAALLTCSNDSGKWLTFDSKPELHCPLPFAHFDDREPNCLVVHHGDQMIERVYNNPTVDANGAYIIDDRGLPILSWEEYFRQRPVRSGYHQFQM
jgi:hypothetical protein